MKDYYSSIKKFKHIMVNFDKQSINRVSYKRLEEGGAVPPDRKDKANKVRGYFWQKEGTGRM